MNILHIASEVTPVAKSGGLADVAAALPMALAEIGYDARVIMPLYKGIEPGEIEARLVGRYTFNAGQIEATAEVYQGFIPGSSLPLYGVRFEPGLKATEMYPVKPGVDEDRFGLFGMAVLAWLAESSWQPEVVHGHDWMAGVAIEQIKSRQLPYKTVLTVHNSKYQGQVPEAALARLGLEYKANAEGLVNQLEAGLLTADHITTVSPTYAAELQQDGLGFGLEEVYGQRQADLTGIVNGLDTQRFSPVHNPLVVPGYTARTAAKAKQQHKHLLQMRLGLPLEDGVPLYGMVSRASSQKGFAILSEVIESSPFLEMGQLVILAGRGTVSVEKDLERLARKYKRHLRVLLGFDDALSHRIYAGADFFVMPSKREPCGLTQMIAMRYGAIPIVHRTGGLADTVIDIRNETEGVGIVFSDYAAQGLGNAVGRSIGLYGNKRLLEAVRQRGMRRDFSWKKPVEEYVAVYERL